LLQRSDSDAEIRLFDAGLPGQKRSGRIRAERGAKIVAIPRNLAALPLPAAAKLAQFRASRGDSKSWSEPYEK
jgi:hypothetical protein